MSPDELRFLSGYDAGYPACINLGSSDAACLRLLDPHLENAYRSGWEWTCRDYDDANGTNTDVALRSIS